MKLLSTSAILLAFVAGPALADEVTVTPPVPGARVDVEHHHDADDATHKKVVIRKNENGCDTKTVKKSNGEGDSVSHTKTNC